MGRKGKKKGANDEDSNVNADDIPAACREIVERLHETFGTFSQKEIYATLVNFNMKQNLAVERLLSQVPFQEVMSNQDEEKETTSDSCSQGVDSSIQHSEIGDGGDHDGDQGGENKLHSDETSNEQGTTNQLADLSTTCTILGQDKSDLTNVEIKKVPIRSAKAVRPPTRMVSTCGSTFADVLKGNLHLSSKENVTEAPVKDDSPSHEKPVATNPSSNAITEPDADQLGESASAPYPQLPDDEDVTNAERHLYKMYAAERDQFQESGSVLQGPPYALYSTFPFNQPTLTRQSNPTAFSLGGWPSTERNQQDMNYNYFQPKVLSGRYSNMLNSPYWWPKQNDSYNYMPPSPAFGGSNNNAYLHQSLDSVLPQYRNSNLPQSATSIGPAAHGFAYGSAYYTSSDNAANQLPSAQHQSVNSNEWPVLGESPHWRSPSFGQSQQVQQSYRGIGNERSSAYDTSQIQQKNRSDPSDQTQQRQCRRDNN